MCAPCEVRVATPNSIDGSSCGLIKWRSAVEGSEVLEGVVRIIIMSPHNNHESA